MSGDFARWAAAETAATLIHDTPRPLVCASCAKPVERTLDDDFQHATVDDGLACTAWPVLPVRDAACDIGAQRAAELLANAGDENWLGI